MKESINLAKHTTKKKEILKYNVDGRFNGVTVEDKKILRKKLRRKVKNMSDELIKMNDEDYSNYEMCENCYYFDFNNYCYYKKRYTNRFDEENCFTEERIND